MISLCFIITCETFCAHFDRDVDYCDNLVAIIMVKNVHILTSRGVDEQQLNLR